MKRLLLTAAALGTLTAPALADRSVIPDAGAMNFAEQVAMWRASAMHQPTFSTKRFCSLAHECSTVEFAVRDDGKGADFFIFPDKAPKDMVWCFVGDHPESRLCQKAGSAPHTTEMWMEGFLPKQGEFREIDYVTKKDPDCRVSAPPVRD
jgi:hypothetical protein